MDPGAILDGLWWTIKEVYFALIPSLVILVQVGQVERRLSREGYPALVALADVGWVAVVPDVDGNLDAILLPLYDIRHTYPIGEVKGTLEDHILAIIR